MATKKAKESSKHQPVALTLSDLPESERSKVSRLAERLVALGTEHQELVEKYAVLESKCKLEATTTSDAISQLKDSSAADIERLTNVISAIDEQRTSAFEMLAQYQERVEQMSEAMRKKEADSISGERKSAILANVQQLESVVENQKSTIASLQKDRDSAEESHKQQLASAAEKVKRFEADVSKKQDQLSKGERRAAAIEMACSRLTKQIKDMTRRDTVKQAEIDALKSLLTARMMHVNNNNHIAPAPIPVPIPAHDEVTQKIEHTRIYSGNESKNSKMGMGTLTEKGKGEVEGVENGVQETNSTFSHSHIHTPPRSVRLTNSLPLRGMSASPMRKLSIALNASKPEEQVQGQGTGSGAGVLSDMADYSMARVTMTATSTSTQHVQVSSSSGSRNDKRSPASPPSPDPSARSLSKSVQTSAIKAPPSADAHAYTHTSKPEYDIESVRQNQMAKRKAKVAARNALDSPLLRHSNGKEENVGSPKSQQRLTRVKRTGVGLSRIPRDRASNSSTATSVGSGATSQSRHSHSYSSQGGGNKINKNSLASEHGNGNNNGNWMSERPKLDVLLGENKLYDPSLLDLLSAMEQ